MLRGSFLNGGDMNHYVTVIAWTITLIVANIIGLALASLIVEYYAAQKKQKNLT